MGRGRFSWGMILKILTCISDSMVLRWVKKFLRGEHQAESSTQCGGWPHLYMIWLKSFCKIRPIHHDHFGSLRIEPARPSLKIAKHLVEWIALDVSWQRQTKTTPKDSHLLETQKAMLQKKPKSLKVFECFVAWMGWAWRKDWTGNRPYPNFEMLLLKDFESQFGCSRFSKSHGYEVWGASLRQFQHRRGGQGLTKKVDSIYSKKDLKCSHVKRNGTGLKVLSRNRNNVPEHVYSTAI